MAEEIKEINKVGNPKGTFIVRIQSERGVTQERYDTKREAVRALANAVSIQKVAPRIWVVKRKN